MWVFSPKDFLTDKVFAFYDNGDSSLILATLTIPWISCSLELITDHIWSFLLPGSAPYAEDPGFPSTFQQQT